MSKTIVALDPGVTTGIAIFSGGEYYAHQFDSRDLEVVYNELKAWRDEDPLYGYEEFQFRPNQKAAELYSKEVIGVTRLFCSMYSAFEPFKYSPDRAKKFWTDDKIKAIKLWKPGRPHAMDALRVLLTHRTVIEPDFNSEIIKVLGEELLRRPQVEKKRSSAPPKTGGPQLFLDSSDFE